MTDNRPLDATNEHPGWGSPAPKTVAPSTDPTPLPPVAAKGSSQRLKLDTALQVRRELKRVYIQAKRGEIKMDASTKFAYILELLSRQIERSELEARIAALEAKGR